MSKTIQPRLLVEDVYKYVSQQSNLTQKQVEECFDTYAKLLISLITSENKPTDMIVTLPKIGIFRFTTVKGRKKGKQYTVPKRLDDNTVVNEVFVVEEDEPDYERIKFDIYDKFNKHIRETTEIKNIKNNSLNFGNI